MCKKLILLGLLIMLTGCNSTNEIVDKEIKKGIVDACYTVLEHNPKDKNERINNYLDKKVQRQVITQSESQIIKECIERTEKSQKWSK